MAGILIVSNSSKTRSILALVLEIGGYGCELAGNLEDASAFLHKASFDITVLDCLQTGWTNALASRLKAIAPTTTMIVLRKTTEPLERETDGFILDHWSPQDLLDLIQNILKRKPPAVEKDYSTITRRKTA